MQEVIHNLPLSLFPKFLLSLEANFGKLCTDPKHLLRLLVKITCLRSVAKEIVGDAVLFALLIELPNQQFADQNSHIICSTLNLQHYNGNYNKYHNKLQ